MLPFAHITIIGLGLIGSSVARAVRAAMPVLVWAASALTVLACEGWIFKDRLAGLVAPGAAYLIGGVLLGAIRAPETPGQGFQAFLASFWGVSGLMFMLGAGGGAFWLGYRLFNPPPPPPRRQPLGTTR